MFLKLSMMVAHTPLASPCGLVVSRSSTSEYSPPLLQNICEERMSLLLLLTCTAGTVLVGKYQ